MNNRWQARLDEAGAAIAIDWLSRDAGLVVVACGPLAAALQLPEAPSPHAVHLEVDYDGVALQLTFHMGEEPAARLRQWLVDRARASRIELLLVPGA